MAIFNMIGGDGGGTGASSYLVASGHVSCSGQSTLTFSEPIYISGYNEAYDALLIEIFRRQYPSNTKTGSSYYYRLINMSIVYMGQMNKPMACWMYRWNDAYVYYGKSLPADSTTYVQLGGTKPSISPGIESVTYTGASNWYFTDEYNYMAFYMKSNKYL